MGKLTCLAFIILVFCNVLMGQKTPVFLAQVSPNPSDIIELINHDVVDKVEKYLRKDPKGLFAIRTCSSDPLPVAFAYSNGGQFFALRLMGERLSSLKYTSNVEIAEPKMFFLRNDKGCKFYGNKSFVEYWFIPSDADFPPFIEIKKTTNTNNKVLIYNYKEFDGDLVSLPPSEDFTSLTPQYYESVKKKLIDLLKEDKTAFVLINYPIYGNSYNNAVQLQTYLINGGIGKHRIFIKKCAASCYIPEEERKTLYPNLTIIYQES